MSLAQLGSILRAQLWSILLMCLVCMAVAYGFAETLPKQYTAKARVMLDIGNAEPTQYNMIKDKGASDYIGTQLRLLRELPVTLTVVNQLGWANDPGVIAQWQADTGGQGDINRWLAARLTGNMGGGQLEDSSIIEIYYGASDVEAAKHIVELLRTSFINNNLAMRVAAAQHASEWNQLEAAKAYTAMVAAQKARLDFMTANDIPMDAETASIENETTTQLQKQTIGNVPEPSPKPSSAMAQLSSQISQADININLMLLQNGPENVETQIAMAKRDALQEALDRETQFHTAGSNATWAMTKANRVQVNDEYLKARLATLDRSPLYDKLRHLDRDLAMKTARYTSAEARVQNFSMIAAAPTGLHVIGDVIADDDPSFPDIPLIVGLAAVFGLLLSVSLAVFMEMLSRRVRGAEDLGFFSQVPVLAVIAPGPPRPGRRYGWSFARLRRHERMQAAE